MNEAAANTLDFYPHQTWLDRRKALINMLRLARLEDLDEQTLHTVCDMLEAMELTPEQAEAAFARQDEKAAA